jgi:ATP-dependent Clp protease ATP-binding subunit ClpA
VIELGLREAIGLGHNYIGTEHLLLGILAEGTSSAARVLAELGVTAQGVRDWVRDTIEQITAAR